MAWSTAVTLLLYYFSIIKRQSGFVNGFLQFFSSPPFRLALAAEGEERGRAQGRAGAIRRRGGAAAFGGPGAFGPRACQTKARGRGLWPRHLAFRALCALPPPPRAAGCTQRKRVNPKEPVANQEGSSLEIGQDLLRVGIGLDLWQHLFHHALFINNVGSAHHPHGGFPIELLFLPHAVSFNGLALRVC